MSRKMTIKTSLHPDFSFMRKREHTNIRRQDRGGHEGVLSAVYTPERRIHTAGIITANSIKKSRRFRIDKMGETGK